MSRMESLKTYLWTVARNRFAPLYACSTACVLAAALVLQPASPAFAGDNNGTTLIKVLGTDVVPRSKATGAVGPLIHDVDDNIVPTLSIAYFLTNNIAVEAICCFTEHSIYQPDGSKLLDAWIFPPTVSLQYHVQLGAFKPYVSVGASYMAFFNEKSYLAGVDLDLKNDWGLSLGGGLDVALGGGWQLSVDVKKIIGLDSEVSVNGAHLATAEIDPWLISVGVGYRFNFSDLLARP